jgi:hypothetical protein
MTTQEFDDKRAKDGTRALQVLSRLQSTYPHMRVGQIIQNALNAAGCKTDLFSIENDILCEALLSFEKLWF